ncbi:MAG: hypothetical protein HOF35_09170 [Bacteroidetes bacterium]|jgi:hypothetical protein|nr:hypothetical protein [Bacteroidota bacterium]
MHIPSVVLSELYAGFYIGAYTKKNITELEDFLTVPGIEVVEVNQAIVEKCGYLIMTLRNQGHPFQQMIFGLQQQH